jgi:cytochrome P450
MAQGYPEIPILVTNDPPEHSRVRKLVNRSFSAPAVAALEPSMVQLVDDLIDAFIDSGRFDFMADFAMPFPPAGSSGTRSQLDVERTIRA